MISFNILLDKNILSKLSNFIGCGMEMMAYSYSYSVKLTHVKLVRWIILCHVIYGNINSHKLIMLNLILMNLNNVLIRIVKKYIGQDWRLSGIQLKKMIIWRVEAIKITSCIACCWDSRARSCAWKLAKWRLFTDPYLYLRRPRDNDKGNQRWMMMIHHKWRLVLG